MIKVYQLRKLQNSYEVVLYYKGVGVKVAFTDGNVYNGRFPKCYVRDPFRQRVIEESELFKSREVVVERVIPEAGDTQPKPAKPAPAPKPQTPQAPAPDAGDGGNGDGDGNGKTGTDMNFGSADEAILYVAQTFGQQITTEKEAREILKANGITPHIKKG